MDWYLDRTIASAFAKLNADPKVNIRLAFASSTGRVLPDTTGATLPPNVAAIESPYVLIKPIDWRELIGTPPPFIWWQNNWLSPSPTLASGPGGGGKTRLWQANATALATGKEYIATGRAPLKVLMWLCEDDRDQIWRQQAAINSHFGLTMDDLGHLHIIPRMGHENTLLDLSERGGKPVWTGLLKTLHEQVNDLKADVLVLDNLAQVFGGIENDRHQATMFVNGIAGLVRDRPFAPVLLGHVARSQGSEYSGSAAWENACRMRWYIGPSLPDARLPAPDDPPLDPNVTYLARRKANYAAKDWMRLHFKGGLFLPEGSETGKPYDTVQRSADAEQVVIEGFNKLREAGITPTDGKTSPDYLPSQIIQKGYAQGQIKKDLTAAMNRLMGTGRMMRGIIGKHSNRTDRFGLLLVAKREQL